MNTKSIQEYQISTTQIFQKTIYWVIYKLNIAVWEARDQRIREAWVKAMETRILRRALTKCYITEGVNHLEHCRHLALEYLSRLRKYRIGGPGRPPSKWVLQI